MRTGDCCPVGMLVNAVRGKTNWVSGLWQKTVTSLLSIYLNAPSAGVTVNKQHQITLYD